MPSIDTNCVLRWLLDDVPEQTKLITALIDSGESIVLSDVALIETVYVLEKIMKISRETIEKSIMAVIKKDAIICNRELFIEILPVYTEHSKLSFVDCYLEVFARKTKDVPLLTFDKKLAKQLSGAQLLS